MEARVKWVENVMFVAESGSGHAIVLDGAPEGGSFTQPPECRWVIWNGCTHC